MNNKPSSIRYGIYLYFNPEAEIALSNIRTKLSEEVPNIPSAKGKLRPHLTVMVFNEAEFCNAEEKFYKFAKSLTKFKIDLPRINFFTGAQNVLFIEPDMTNELKQTYLNCYEVFSQSRISNHYKNPEAWNPHITIAKRISDETLVSARKLAETSWRKIPATIIGAALMNLMRPNETLTFREI